jgi:hypothetical protein
MELFPDQQQAYEEEQQAQAHAWRIDTKRWVAQCHHEFASEQVVLDAQMTELHQRKAVMEMEWATTIDFTKAQARARVIAAAINHEGTPHPTFTRASQNVATVAALFDTLSEPSTDGVGKVYQRLKDILGVAAEQQAESSLQQQADVFISSPGRSKVSRQGTKIEHPTAGTASSPMLPEPPVPRASDAALGSRGERRVMHQAPRVWLVPWWAQWSRTA